MKPPVIAAVVVVLASLLASCSSKPERVSHPTVAMLTLEQPKPGWMGSDKSPHELVLRAVNGQPVTDAYIRGGKLLAPGWQKITLGARSTSGAAMGARLGGETGAGFGARLDATASSRFDRTLTANLQVDHDYVARMKKHHDHYEFMIEDLNTGWVVARSHE